MGAGRLLLVHHFPLDHVTGVTVMMGGLLDVMPWEFPDLKVSYLHYEGINEVSDLRSILDGGYSNTDCVVAANLHIEVKWEFSIEIARWCKQKSLSLINNVQDYWPQHYSHVKELTDKYGVQLGASSSFIMNSLRNDGFAAFHLPMGVQTPTVLTGRQGTKTVVGCIGRIVRRKRFPDVVRAFYAAGLDRSSELWLTLIPSRVFDQMNDADHFGLVNAEIERPAVRAESVRIFTKPITPPDYSMYSMYVCASDYEGFSMTPYEAAYAGCPPIVSDIPPHRAMAERLFGDGAELFLFPVGNVNGLALHLRDEATSQRRKLLLERLQVQIRATIDEFFSFKTTARAISNLLPQCRAVKREGLIDVP